MHSVCGLTVNEVIKGGSLGQGTAVPGHFDLDMVVYSSGKSGREYRLTIDKVFSRFYRHTSSWYIKRCHSTRILEED